jgi:hypothetical protein
MLAVSMGEGPDDWLDNPETSAAFNNAVTRFLAESDRGAVLIAAETISNLVSALRPPRGPGEPAPRTRILGRHHSAGRRSLLWLTHYPPKGWFCHCTVQSLSAADLDRYGYVVSDQAPESQLVPQLVNGESVMVPAGIDPGFALPAGRTTGARWRRIGLAESCP